MAKQRKAAYGGPAEEKEVVIQVDRRLVLILGVFGVLMAFGAAVALGARSSGGAVQTAGIGGQTSVDKAAAEKARLDAELRANDLNPDTTTIIGGGNEISAIEPGQVQVPPEFQAGGSDIIQSVPPGSAGLEAIPDELQNMEGASPFTVPEDRPSTDHWTHDVLAFMEDPNVSQDQYQPFRTEDVKTPADGPRLAISDLNEFYTYNFGAIPMGETVTHDFQVTNVGDEDLLISRVYTGCGCTSTRIADVVLDAAGWVVGKAGVKEPFRLAPGESTQFDVEFDPRAEGKPGAQAKYIQIYSNDPTKAVFDPADANSHETRFRIVVEPRFGVTSSGDEG
jgi:hypothetical protein